MKNPRGKCKFCGKKITILSDGVLHAHGRRNDWCDGTWKLPDPGPVAADPKNEEPKL